MYPRTEYEMTEADLEKILDASKATVCILVGISGPSDPQENANRAWAELGGRMGFDYMSVRPIEGKGNRFFTAVPSEPENLKRERLSREQVERLKVEVHRCIDGLVDGAPDASAASKLANRIAEVLQ